MKPDAAWLAQHVRLLRESFHHWTGHDLIPPELDDQQAVEALDQAPYALVSHGTETDPVFNYANRTALTLFEMPWDAFTALPSRLSAEPLVQAERDRLMLRVTQNGFIDDYRGVRVSKQGKRFMISDATIWNVVDDQGIFHGQAAQLRCWKSLP